MSKQAISTTYQPPFVPGAANAGTLNFGGYTGFVIGGLYAVINQTRNVILYAAGVTGVGYFSFGGNILTLQLDTSTMNAADQLLVIYDTFDIGTAYDATAGTDGGTFSLISIMKRIASKLPIVGSGAGALATALSLAVSPSAEVTNGTAGQTATTNNLLALGGAVTDALGYRTIGMQFVPAGTIAAGTVVFEASVDATNWGAYFVYDSTNITAAPVSTFVIATATPRYFIASTPFRYFRARLSVAVTGAGGSVQGFATLSTLPFHPTSQQVQQATAASLNVTATVTPAATNLPTNITQIATAVAAALVAATGSNKLLGVIAGAAGSNADRTSASLVANGTLTSATIPADFGSSYAALISVTAISGTLTTLDCVLQESFDNGTTWQDIYHATRFTVAGGVATTTVPAIALGGRRRWSYTVGSSASPSVTFLITAMQGQGSPIIVRRFYDRTLNAAQPIAPSGLSFNCEGCSNITLSVSSGAVVTTPCSVQLQFSNNGTDWYNASAVIATVASSTVAITSTAGMQAKLCRVNVTVAGNGQTLNFIEFFGTN